MSDKLFYLFFVFILCIPIYIITKTKFGKKINKTIHKIISSLIFSAFTGILIIAFYETNRLFVVFVPFIIGFYLILGYSLNVELSDENKAALVTMRPYGTVNMKVIFFEIVTFPAFYLISSWKNNPH
jgi:xanthine/uracil permease